LDIPNEPFKLVGATYSYIKSAGKCRKTVADGVDYSSLLDLAVGKEEC
jgi:hypothetical protein